MAGILRNGVFNENWARGSYGPLRSTAFILRPLFKCRNPNGYPYSKYTEQGLESVICFDL